METALAVLAAEWGHALTMRAVADQIGISASSLYGYVANKEELVQPVFDRIGEKLAVPETAGDWQQAVKEFARNVLAGFRRYPGVAALTLGWVVATPSMLSADPRGDPRRALTSGVQLARVERVLARSAPDGEADGVPHIGPECRDPPAW